MWEKGKWGAGRLTEMGSHGLEELEGELPGRV